MVRTFERLRVDVERLRFDLARLPLAVLRVDAVRGAAPLRDDTVVRRERACELPRAEAERERDVVVRERDAFDDRVLLEREAVVPRERDLRVGDELREVLVRREFARELLRDVVVRERAPVLRFLGEPVVRERADVARELVSPVRDVLREREPPARDVRDDGADFFRVVLPELRVPDAARDREAVEREREDAARVPELRRELTLRVARRLPPVALAFSRPTSLLKLLFCPRAVWSCTSSARLLSSNFSNQSSHSMASSESAPL
jgi:hypothetical protein